MGKLAATVDRLNTLRGDGISIWRFLRSPFVASSHNDVVCLDGTGVIPGGLVHTPDVKKPTAGRTQNSIIRNMGFPADDRGYFRSPSAILELELSVVPLSEKRSTLIAVYVVVICIHDLT